MGKKSDTAIPVTASAETPASNKKATGSISGPPTKSDPAANGDGVAKAAAKKAPAKKAVKKAPARKAAAFSNEDIALRAYFIAEHRHRHGLHGDEHSDWVEAERQLKADRKKAAAKKPATTKKRA